MFRGSFVSVSGETALRPGSAPPPTGGAPPPLIDYNQAPKHCDLFLWAHVWEFNSQTFNQAPKHSKHCDLFPWAHVWEFNSQTFNQAPKHSIKPLNIP